MLIVLSVDEHVAGPSTTRWKVRRAVLHGTIARLDRAAAGRGGVRDGRLTDYTIVGGSFSVPTNVHPVLKVVTLRKSG